MTDHQMNPEDRALIERVAGPLALMEMKAGQAHLEWATVSRLLDAARAEGRRSPGEAADALGAWMSAALDDPKVCDAMKADIRAWFDAGQPAPPPSGGVREAVADIIGYFKAQASDHDDAAVRSDEDAAEWAAHEDPHKRERESNSKSCAAHSRHAADQHRARADALTTVLALLWARDEAALPEAVGWMAISTAGRSKGGKKFEHHRSDAEQYGREIYTEGFEVRPVYDHAPPSPPVAERAWVKPEGVTWEAGMEIDGPNAGDFMAHIRFNDLDQCKAFIGAMVGRAPSETGEGK